MSQLSSRLARFRHGSVAPIVHAPVSRYRRIVQTIVYLTSADLKGAMLPVDPPVEPTKRNLQFTLKPGGISLDFKNPDAIFWRSPVASDRSRDIAEVGYFVSRSRYSPASLFCDARASHVLVAAFGDFLDQLGAEGGDIIGFAARDDAVVDDYLLVEPVPSRILDVALDRRP